jgi:acetyl-CoA carboxylase biotin carboxyl carrier protein
VAVIDIVSEVTGTVWKIEAQVGQRLAKDDTVLVIESMKMEIPLCAPEDGTLLEVLVSEADVIQEGAVVARLQKVGT